MSVVQSRRHFLAALSSITAAAVTGSSRSFAQEASPETSTIRLGKNDGICIAPQYIANELLRLEGFIDVQHVTRLPTDMSTAIGRGDVDFSLEFAAQLIPAIETAVPVTVLGGVHVGCFELFAHEGIRNITSIRLLGAVYDTAQESLHMDDVLTHESWNKEHLQECNHLAQADRLIAELNKRIARQRLIVRAAAERGRLSIEAESLLRALNEARRALERHRQLILDLLANGGSPHPDGG